MCERETGEEREGDRKKEMEKEEENSNTTLSQRTFFF